MSQDDVAIQFLANLINERETAKAGYSKAVRWLCLREDLQEKYLTEARAWVASWWQDETTAQIRRNEYDVSLPEPQP